MNAKRGLYGWGPLGALAAMVALESGERLSLSQAVDGIKEEFGVGDVAVGALPVAMATVAVFGAVPMGFLADRRRRTTLLAIAIVIWTVCMGINGLVSTYLLLFVFRMGVGAVEATGPAAVSLLADYYPVKDRARTLGLYQSGALAGAIVGAALGGVFVDQWGWRGRVPDVGTARRRRRVHPEQAARTGARRAGCRGVRGRSRHRRRGRHCPPTAHSPDPSEHGGGQRAASGARAAQGPSMWFALLAVTLGQLLLTGIQFWAVEFFKREHDLGASGAGGIASVFGLGAAVGVLGGGFLSDRWLRRGVLCARVYVVAIGSVGAAIVLAPAFAAPRCSMSRYRCSSSAAP